MIREKHMNRFHGNTFAIIICLSFIRTSALPPDSMTVNLKEVSVVATRTEKDLAGTGRSVSVITREDLDKNTCTTLGELIATLPGITVAGEGQTPGATESVFIRGANSNQTAVFLDGVRISDVSSVNNAPDLAEIPVSSIERIEIIRGCHSSLYGSSAIGGVIRITTKRPLQPGWSGETSLTGGIFGKSAGTINPFATLSYDWKNGIYISAIVDHTSTKGIDATLDTVSDPNIFKNRDRDNWRKTNATFQAGYSGNKVKTHVAFERTIMNTDIDKAAFTDDDNYTLDFNRSLYTGSIEYKPVPSLALNVSGGYSESGRHAVNDSSIVSADGTTDHQFTEDHYKGQSANADVNIIWIPGKIQLLGGASFTLEKMRQDNFLYSAAFPPFILVIHSSLDSIRPHAETVAGYVQAEIPGSFFADGLERFQLTGSIRFTQHSISGDKITFEINPSLKLGEKSLLYFCYSTGFNSPSLYQLYAPEKYYTWDANYTTGLTRGNRMLKPEYAQSFEFGLKSTLSESSLFTISLFKNVNDNQIEYAYLWNPAIPEGEIGTDFNRDDYRGDRYINAGKQTSYGGEISIISELTKHWHFRGTISLINGYLDYNYSLLLKEQAGGNTIQLYNTGEFLTSSSRVYGLIRRPSTAFAELQYRQQGKWSAGITIRYSGSRDDVFYDITNGPFGSLSPVAVRDYTLTDLQGTCQLTKNLQVSTRMENIFDTRYSEINGFRCRGRGVYLKLQYFFRNQGQ